MTFKDIFPGLSRSWNFQEKIQDFPGGVRTLRNNTQSVLGPVGLVTGSANGLRKISASANT